MKRDFNVRYFDRGSHELIPDCWAWVAERERKAIGLLTVTLRGECVSRGESFPECAQVRMLCTDRNCTSAGVASWLVRQAIKKLREGYGLKLYRSGVATEGGRKVLENLGVAIDPLRVRAYERYLDELAACPGGKDECLVVSPYEYLLEDAEKKREEDLAQAQVLLESGVGQQPQ
ncbi:hypothetical protein G352_23906 [Rhodococcus ruber BKS 20-38]|uniref:N-acetyltransferase domain-containing protein n=1 Tax=Rhodococcus ruber BKS 20-38 TaxID=1278076 RepID=M2YZF8_9NOCA|nr:GNAT family N-acetyltransferase [Rhodococcus ruber]EME53739.1 hypothetical protein G352_23906 [Rhodococcus ruber BKS 20-38]